MDKYNALIYYILIYNKYPLNENKNMYLWKNNNIFF